MTRSLVFNRKGQVIISKLRIGHDKLTCSRLVTKNQPEKCNRYNFVLSVDYRLNRSNVLQQKIKFALSNEIQIRPYRKGYCKIYFLKDINLYHQLRCCQSIDLILTYTVSYYS